MAQEKKGVLKMTRRLIDRAKKNDIKEVTAGAVASVNYSIGGGDPSASVYASVAPKKARRRKIGAATKPGMIAPPEANQSSSCSSGND